MGKCLSLVVVSTLALAGLARGGDAKKDLEALQGTWKFESIKESFAKAPKTSIDYAVMERTSRAVVLTADVGWSDVGEWSAVWRLSPRDAGLCRPRHKVARSP